MAKSKYEYVKNFEIEDRALPSTWLVVRIDGHNFHKFTQVHDFQKPNDERGLQLMNACADGVMAEFGDIVMAFGESDEYSFVFHKDANIYKRRQRQGLGFTAAALTRLRTVECHINNLYNTIFWAIVQSGKTEAESEELLRRTTSADKNEMLFSQFNINYNAISPMYRKGTFKFKEEIQEEVPNTRGEGTVKRTKKSVRTIHEDIIGDQFWNAHPYLLK